MRWEEHKMGSIRAVSWKHEVICDLLLMLRSEWAALRESHRHYNGFEEIAKAMVECGHQRTGEECRTKTKGIWQVYMRALAHNVWQFTYDMPLLWSAGHYPQGGFQCEEEECESQPSEGDCSQYRFALTVCHPGSLSCHDEGR